MQVFQWVFRVVQDQKPAHNRATQEIKGLKVEENSKAVVHYKQKRVSKRGQKPEETTLDCRNLKYLALLIRRGNSRAYFSSTLNQKRPSSLNNYSQIHPMKIKKEDLVRGLGLSHNKADSSAHVGNKVLPISDSSTSSSSTSSSSNADDQQQCGPLDQKIKEKVKGDKENNNHKTKTLSRMKELLRWAAAAKTGKGGQFGRKVLHFRNRSATIKSGAFDDQLTNDSPKISFRWEVESCTTTCSAASAPPALIYDQCSHHRPGNWITTDDEFVVLEL